MTHQPTTQEATQSPQEARDRELDALLDVYRSDATEAEHAWLRHQIERGLAARELRLRGRAA